MPVLSRTTQYLGGVGGGVGGDGRGGGGTCAGARIGLSVCGVALRQGVYWWSPGVRAGINLGHIYAICRAGSKSIINGLGEYFQK